jgi:YidC/Oxa1 family membrane protein insertase
VFGKIAKEEEAKKQEAIARRAANAPAPGVKPDRRPKKPTAPTHDAESTESTKGTESSDIDLPGGTSEPNAGSNGSVGRTPRPGARPKKRRR